MIFSDLAGGDQVFLDSNTLVYHFGPHPVLGQSCNQLIQRIEGQDLLAFTSTHVLSEVAHRPRSLSAETTCLAESIGKTFFSRMAPERWKCRLARDSTAS